eukprot:CAMPEP_0181042622 /NCGR_PEP_ID=MMETSP1070-20121207/12252_1 /TAXON_ID=265543 /ORGANISM="Minutocellus polymorphus, Strain NH13" /LENGTH=355 /DNA_ID=CAMNT_0023120855 /DNA_START=1969 /DNA_END=3036 /DNA_ORIENTATION=-
MSGNNASSSPPLRCGSGIKFPLLNKSEAEEALSNFAKEYANVFMTKSNANPNDKKMQEQALIFGKKQATDFMRVLTSHGFTIVRNGAPGETAGTTPSLALDTNAVVNHQVTPNATRKRESEKKPAHQQSQQPPKRTASGGGGSAGGGGQSAAKKSRVVPINNNFRAAGSVVHHANNADNPYSTRPTPPAPPPVQTQLPEAIINKASHFREMINDRCLLCGNENCYPKACPKLVGTCFKCAGNHSMRDCRSNTQKMRAICFSCNTAIHFGCLFCHLVCSKDQMHKHSGAKCKNSLVALRRETIFLYGYSSASEDGARPANFGDYLVEHFSSEDACTTEFVRIVEHAQSQLQARPRS